MESAEIIHRNSYEIKDIMSVMHCSANILIFGFNTASTFELDCFSNFVAKIITEESDNFKFAGGAETNSRVHVRIPTVSSPLLL